MACNWRHTADSFLKRHGNPKGDTRLGETQTMTTPDNQPHVPQIRIGLEAKVTILFPEETFTPLVLEGVTRDISASGMRVVATGVSEELYGKVLHHIRHAKVILNPPGWNRDITLRGRIVWLDYDNKAAPPTCTFGITLENSSDEAQASLKDLVMRVVQKIRANDN